MMTETQLFKILLIGDSGVGKTTLLDRYIHDSYIPAPEVTSGVNFKSSSVEIEPGVQVKLYIWDTCGVERYRTIVSNYTRGIHGFLLLFDLTNRQSFENIKNEWIPFVDKSLLRVPCVLVGHKSDHKNRCASQEEAEELAKELDAPYVEASSVTGHNVNEGFKTLVQQIYRKILNAKNEWVVVESGIEPQKEEPGASGLCFLM